MANRTIAVPFTPLLEKVVVALGLGTPLYYRGESEKAVAYVVVPTKTGPSAYLFPGREASTVAESCADAAKKAILHFVKEKNVIVHDINSEKQQRLKKCRDLYMFKRHELECIEKGIDRLEVDVATGQYGNIPADGDIYIDFLELLSEVVVNVNIPVTPIECVQLRPAEYEAWFTFAHPGSEEMTDCIIGDRAISIVEAKQSLAKKAIRCLMPLYGFTIEDVSYHLLDMAELGVKIARQNYLKAKERVQGLQEDIALAPLIVEQDQLTPRGPKFTIPVPKGPPLPPKKRRIGESSKPSYAVEPTITHSTALKEFNLFYAPAPKQ